MQVYPSKQSPNGRENYRLLAAAAEMGVITGRSLYARPVTMVVKPRKTCANLSVTLSIKRFQSVALCHPKAKGIKYVSQYLLEDGSFDGWYHILDAAIPQPSLFSTHLSSELAQQ
jgi:hypothetical protein